MFFRLLPALLPSWRFFDAVGPSPRVDWALLAPHEGLPEAHWRAFRPCPPRITPIRALGRLFWNPVGNETLYVVRCAERLLEGERGFVEQELRRRLADAASRGELGAEARRPGSRLTLRVRALRRCHEAVVDEVVHVAEPFTAGQARGR